MTYRIIRWISKTHHAGSPKLAFSATIQPSLFDGSMQSNESASKPRRFHSCEKS
jgi:hypothetical protein